MHYSSLDYSFSKLIFPEASRFSLGEKSSAYGTYPFSVEKKDGTISKLSIPLNNSNPHQILECMAASINYPPPPPPPVSLLSESTSLPHNEQGNLKSKANQNGAVRNDVDQFIWSQGSYHGQQQHKSPSSMNRDVVYFLKNIDFDHIKQRKLDRINAIAAVLVARRAWQFMAIDGTGLGWSSASLAICISRLTSLHEEHQSKLRTKSFYPFRIMLTSDEFQRKVDLFGGIIRLNPAATMLQWLGTLLTVTDESVRMLKKNQISLKKNLSQVENALGLRVVKGHTCGPVEYHRCIKKLALESQQNNYHGEGTSLVAVSKEASVVIESEQAYRRGKLRRDGSFEIGAGMDLQKIRKTLGDFAIRSHECIRIESEKRARCEEIVDQIMYEFGVQRVNKVSSMVTSDQMSDCLSLLLDKDEAEKEVMKQYLAGQSIGIAGRGQLCHLGDDGSIIIPTNCS